MTDKRFQGREHRLTPEERARNDFSESWRFTYDPQVAVTYPSSYPGFFPDLHGCHTRMVPFHLPTLDGLHFVKGLCEGVLLGKDAVAGFPSLSTVSHSAQLGFHSVNVFQSDSRNETMVVTIDNAYEGMTVEDIARMLIGKRTFVNWPYLQEAQISAVSDELFRYELDETNPTGVIKIPHRQNDAINWRKTADRVEFVYSKRFGVIIGNVDVVLHGHLLKGERALFPPELCVEYFLTLGWY
jgi:5'-3' exoribonuclease 1